MTRRGAVVVSAIVFEGALLGLAFLQGTLFGTPPFEALAWRWDAVLWAVAGTPPLFLMLWWSGKSEWPPAVRLRAEMEEVVRALFLDATPLDLLIISLAAGIGEEAFFRGVLQVAFGAWTVPAGGLIIASVLFGLAHFVTPLYAFLAGVIGLYLGGVFLLTGNLLVPIGIHVLYDFAALWWVTTAAGRGGRGGRGEERR